MSAYFILMQQVNDVDRYMSDYVPQAMPLLQKHKGEVVVASFDAKKLEGEPPNSVVIARFPNEEAIHAFENDPDYQPYKKLRMEISSNGQAVAAPEFTPPS